MALKKIEKLTSDQTARFVEFIERWTAIGLSTEPADRSRAEDAIRAIYAAGGIKAPDRIVWCGSPLSQGLTRAVFLKSPSVRASVWASVRDSVRASVGDSVGASVWDSVGASVRASVWASVWDSVRTSVWDSVRDSVRASVWDSVWDSVGASVRASVGASVWDSVRDSVWDSVRTSVWDSVRDSVGASVWDSVRDSVWDSVYGQHDAGWLAFYRYFYDVVDLKKQTEKLGGLWELAQSAGWVLPHANICWVSERHNVLRRDDRGRLHCLTGPACGYPDGFAIHAVHGVRVPAFVIEAPEKIAVATIDKESNAEVRRVMIDRYRHGEEIHGAAAYISDAGGKRLDHNESFGTLWRREVRGDEPITMVEVVNRTPEPTGEFKRYWLRVPPTIKTAHEAVAWTFGKTPKEYRPVAES